MSKKVTMHRPDPIVPTGSSGPSVKQVAGWWLTLAVGSGIDEAFLDEIRRRLPGWLEAGAPMNARYVSVDREPFPATVEELISAPSPWHYFPNGADTTEMKCPVDQMTPEERVATVRFVQYAYWNGIPRYKQSFDAELHAELMDKVRRGCDEATARAWLSSVYEAGVVLFAQERHIVPNI